MTDRTKRNLEIASLAIFSIVFGAGAGWGTTQARLGSVAASLDSLSVKVSRIDGRVSEIYCATLPVDKQPGCR